MKSYDKHSALWIYLNDCGTAFMSLEFEKFTLCNGIIYRKSAPYHTSSNAIAEMAVETLKEGLRQFTGSLESLYKFLFQFRITPHSTTGQIPAEWYLEDL